MAREAEASTSEGPIVASDWKRPRVEEFRALVYAKAAECHRDLPWRRTTEPWAILVSELMLQQTQAARVVPKYLAWMERFPDARSLAEAPLPEVLSLWSGLGYNRRALALKKAAEVVAALPEARIPPDEAFLLSLPGVGPYTARAVLAFAFDLPGVFLETNVRTVILKHYFPGRTGVPDAELEEVAAEVLDRAAPRNWYNALMDYGVEIKRSEANHSRRAANYARQSPFATSFRRVRGMVLKALVKEGSVDLDRLASSLPFSRELVEEGAKALVAEGFAEYSVAEYSVAEYSAAEH